VDKLPLGSFYHVGRRAESFPVNKFQTLNFVRHGQETILQQSDPKSFA